ncbi:MAG: helix-turn-helix domain-containing protein [SAR86 cluster bacterium]|nr:helix-turn-helix domain-containing protein [SAR86 cluster bacterium]
MSSNIRINLICEECGNDFTAKTTVTKYCSKKCNSRAYKRAKRTVELQPIIQKSNRNTQKVRDNLSLKEFLSVTEVSKLIGCSRQNVYKLIKSGKLNATNLLEKKTIVRRVDLDQLFNEISNKKKIKQQEMTYSVSECYAINEIIEKFEMSESALYSYIKRNNIPKVKKRRNVYIPKIFIDKLFG